LFVGDTFGSIQVFNISNGVFIKYVNDEIQDKIIGEEKLEGEIV
jgi:hypothetical protein